MANIGNTTARDMATEKGEAVELEHGHGSNDEIDGGTNHHSWDNHTSFNKYPTHEPGYENKVRISSLDSEGAAH